MTKETMTAEKAVSPTNVRATIVLLQNLIEENKDNDQTAHSWGFQEGVLISGERAAALVKMLSALLEPAPTPNSEREVDEEKIKRIAADEMKHGNRAWE